MSAPRTASPAMGGGEVLAPGTGQDAIQYMDVNDLAAWLMSAIERGLTGRYNAVGPDPALTLGEYIEACRAVTNSDARVTWVSEAFLNAHDIRAKDDIPFWTPSSLSRGFMAVDGAKARTAGLTYRPLAETIRSELAWFREAFPVNYQFGNGPSSGITAAREAALLQEWHASAAASPGVR